jgi:glycosyltransferase involved in cell wall biosynthesis
MTVIKNKKKSVVMFSTSYEPLAMGGAEIQTKRLTNELIKKDIDVFIITVGNNNLPTSEIIDGIQIFRFVTFISRIKQFFSIKKNVEISNIKTDVIFDYSNKNGKDLLYSGWKYNWWKQLIVFIDILLNSFLLFYKKRKNFQIIQIMTVTYFAVIATIISKILRKKIIITDSTMDGILQMYMTPFPNIARKFISKNANFVALTDVILYNYQKAGISLDKIIKIPNGIEILPIPEIRKDFEYKCLFVGNLYQQPAKGIDILLKAWGNVIVSFPQATLTIVGDGDITVYRRYVEQLGYNNSIIFTGKASPKEYYLSHDVFVLPSRREGMSNALIEAMMYGLPVVATNISGNQDLIDENMGGYLVQPNDEKQLSQKIINLLQNKEQAIQKGQYNREKIKQMCSMEKVTNLYIDCYSNIYNN